MATFGKLASQNAALKSLAGDNETTQPIKYIPIEEICPRFENKYITNVEKSKSLINSIKTVGLIEPINIIPIDKYISKKDVTEKERNYFEKMAAKGIKYFVSSGHRRFRAYISITLGYEINTDEEWVKNYDFIKEKCLETKKNTLSTMLGNIDVDVDDRWITIPCIVSEKELENEDKLYNDSNTTQRELTGFEIITNVIDEMKKTGYWNEMIQRIKIDRVNNMTDRRIREKINELVKLGILEKDYIDSSLKAQREKLMQLDSMYVPGTEKPINEEIVNYISTKKQREVSVTNVNYTRKILETFDDRLIQLIFDGLLKFKDAKEIYSVYQDIDIEETIKSIKEGNFTIKEIKRKRTRIKYTSRQLVDFIYEIRNGKRTLEEVIKLIENNEY